MTNAWDVISQTPLEGELPALGQDGPFAAPPAAAPLQAQPQTAPQQGQQPQRPAPDSSAWTQPATPPPLDRQLNEDVLKNVPQPIATQVRLLAAGRIPPPSSFAATRPYWQSILSLAAQYDPQFDAVSYGSRHQALKDVTSGVTSRNLTALNTVMQHIDELDQAGRALDNFKQSPIPYVGVANRARSTLLEHQGDPRIKRFDTAANAVANEVERAFRGSQTAISGIQEWRRTMSPSMSPEQMRTANQTLLKLLDGRIEAVTDQYRRAFGTTRPPIDFLSPKARETFERLVRDEGAAPQQPAAAPSAPKAAPKSQASTPNVVRQNGILYQRQPDGSYKPIE